MINMSNMYEDKFCDEYYSTPLYTHAIYEL